MQITPLSAAGEAGKRHAMPGMPELSADSQDEDYDLEDILSAAARRQEENQKNIANFGVMSFKVYEAARQHFDHERALDEMRSFIIVMLSLSFQRLAAASDK